VYDYLLLHYYFHFDLMLLYDLLKMTVMVLVMPMSLLIDWLCWTLKRLVTDLMIVSMLQWQMNLDCLSDWLLVCCLLLH
jgi:hypothetical protein